jgi:hypothetical protein
MMGRPFGIPDPKTFQLFGFLNFLLQKLVYSQFLDFVVGEATNTNFIVFVLTRSRLEPTIYRTRGEHANTNTTDAVANEGFTSYIGMYLGVAYTCS